MLKRWVLFTSCLTAGCFISASLSHATIAPSSPSMVVPVVIPESDTIPIPRSPLPSGEFQLDLPSTTEDAPQPRYDEQPVKPAPLPVRLVIQLSKRRVTVYRGAAPVKTYAIAVGKPGWETPKGTYQVKQMFRNPTWIHPLKKGITIPGGDPENPLGRFWIGFWTDGKNWIGFHGTPNPGSVGTAASHGCIRMYNKDIEELFQKVSLGTEVKVVQ